MQVINSAILRVTDTHFIELPIDDAFCVNETGRLFTVSDDDSYHEITYGHIVLANRLEEGSKDIAWFLIDDDETGDAAIVKSIDYEDLKKIVFTLVKDYYAMTGSSARLQ